MTATYCETYQRNARTTTAVTVVPSAAALAWAACQRSVGIRRLLAVVGTSAAENRAGEHAHRPLGFGGSHARVGAHQRCERKGCLCGPVLVVGAAVIALYGQHCAGAAGVAFGYGAIGLGAHGADSSRLVSVYTDYSNTVYTSSGAAC